MKGLRLETLRELVAAGSVRDILLVAHGRKWSVMIRTGMAESPLLTDRGQVREFGKLETAVSLIRDTGIGRLTLDATQFDKHQQSLRVGRTASTGAQRASHP